MNNKLTEQKYWENYYKKGYAKKKHIIDVCSYYDKFWDILIDNKSDNKKTLIEIGGYPGRYLAYLSNKYKVKPTCLDYNSDESEIKKVFDVMEIEEYFILNEDFTVFEPLEKYDFVISNGFIEHFTDFDTILDKHVHYLKEDGKMLIMIPNMRGYIKFYKYLVDWKNLKLHNLECMRLKVFRDFAKRNNLNIEFLGYYGEFPFNVHQKLNFVQKIIFKTHRILFKKIINSFLLKSPSHYFSSSIVAIFEKS